MELKCVALDFYLYWKIILLRDFRAYWLNSKFIPWILHNSKLDKFDDKNIQKKFVVVVKKLVGTRLAAKNWFMPGLRFKSN